MRHSPPKLHHVSTVSAPRTTARLDRRNVHSFTNRQGDFDGKAVRLEAAFPNPPLSLRGGLEIVSRRSQASNSGPGASLRTCQLARVSGSPLYVGYIPATPCESTRAVSLAASIRSIPQIEIGTAGVARLGSSALGEAHQGSLSLGKKRVSSAVGSNDRICDT